MMMTIDNEILIKFVTGNCSEDELLQVKDWMEQSKDNADQVLAFERIYREAQATTMSKGQIEKALEHVHNRIALDERNATRKRNVVVLRRWSIAAATIALMIIVGTGLWTWSETQKSKKLAVQYVVELGIKGETRQVNLPDGTKVWLNNGASIKYPKRFGAYQRDVWLNGEGYFEVMKNPDRPFIVNSNIARVKVLGTIFNFKIDNKRKEAIVSLISGKIKVTGAHGEGSTLLIPGQKAIVNAKTRNLIVEKANTRLDAVWHNGVIPFTNASIPDIATSLEQIYGVKIIVEKGVDTTHTYSGGIPLAANIDTALKHLCNTLPAKVKTTGEIIYLVP